MMISILILLLIALAFIWLKKRFTAIFILGIYLIFSIVVFINDMTAKLTLQL